MPQEVISIQNFGGMMTNPHKEDIPDNMGVYAYNIDPQTELGVLKGIKQSGAAYQAENPAVNIPDVYEADWLKYEVSSVAKWDLIYIDKNGGDITAVEDFYAVEASRILTDLVTADIEPRCVKTFNNAVQIGNGVDDKANVVYRLLEDKEFFNYSVGVSGELVSAGLQVENGECYAIASDTNGSIYISDVQGAPVLSGGTNFFTDIYYGWAISLVYDGLQESQLYKVYSRLGDDVNYFRVVITAKNLDADITGLDTRVTAVKLYRAESSNETEANLGLYRLVKTIDINTGDDIDNVSGSADAAVTVGATFLKDTRLNMEVDAYAGNTVKCDLGGGDIRRLYIGSNTADTFNGILVDWSGGGTPPAGSAWTLEYTYGWVGGGTDYTLNYFDGNSYPDGGATYEEETGMPESLEYQSIRYAVNEVGGGYHWVANGEPEGESETDWQRYLFRSKKFRPNMFDWARDFLVLPEIPTALAWYNDRLYAFSENTVYRINPELLYIEDTFFGAGASHRQSVFVSEYGLYFCNLNGAYRIQDSGIEVISDLIAETPSTGSYIGWKAFASATASSNFDRIVIKAENDKRLILFVGATATQASDCLGFYIPTGQWYRFGLGLITLTANSGLYGGKDGEVYISNGDASYRLFAGANIETSFAWVSKEFHLGEPSQNKSWNMIKWDATVGSGYAVAVKYDFEGTDPSANTATSGAWINQYKKSMQVKIEGTMSGVTSAKVDSLDIIVRRLFGKR